MDSRKSILQMYAAIVLGFLWHIFVMAMIALGTYTFLDIVWEWIT